MTNRVFRESIIEIVRSKIAEYKLEEIIYVPKTRRVRRSYDAHIRFTKQGIDRNENLRGKTTQILSPEMGDLIVNDEPCHAEHLKKKSDYIEFAIDRLDRFIEQYKFEISVLTEGKKG